MYTSSPSFVTKVHEKAGCNSYNCLIRQLNQTGIQFKLKQFNLTQHHIHLGCLKLQQIIKIHIDLLAISQIDCCVKMNNHAIP